MACEYCLRDFGHSTRCPNYVPPKANHYCSICNDGIYDGESYIVNDSGDLCHKDCFYRLHNSEDWIGYAVRTMED